MFYRYVPTWNEVCRNFCFRFSCFLGVEDHRLSCEQNDEHLHLYNLLNFHLATKEAFLISNTMFYSTVQVQVCNRVTRVCASCILHMRVQKVLIETCVVLNCVCKYIRIASVNQVLTIQGNGNRLPQTICNLESTKISNDGLSVWFRPCSLQNVCQTSCLHGILSWCFVNKLRALSSRSLVYIFVFLLRS